MSELIIPPGVKADYRPYRGATTQALLYELQQRQVVAELSGQIMPPPLEQELTKEQEQAYDALRLEQFKQMASQMGIQILQSQWAYAGVHRQPNLVDPDKQDELLVMRILLCRHPLTQPAAAGALFPAAEGEPLSSAA